MDRSDKEKEIKHLHEEFNSAKNLFLTGFEGLTVNEDLELRRSIRASGSKYRVIRNRLTKRAAQGTPVEAFEQELKGANGLAYNDQDAVALAKAISTYAKDHPRLVFKVGIVEGRVIELEDLNHLASLPTKEALISKIMFLLNAGAQRVASVVQAVPRGLAVVLDQASKEKKFSE